MHHTIDGVNFPIFGIKEICAIKENDGILFDVDALRIDLIREQLESAPASRAIARRRPLGAILLYTGGGGMPSPSWKRVYRLLLLSLPSDARVLHWGDIGAEGFVLQII